MKKREKFAGTARARRKQTRGDSSFNNDSHSSTLRSFKLDGIERPFRRVL